MFKKFFSRNKPNNSESKEENYQDTFNSLIEAANLYGPFEQMPLELQTKFGEKLMELLKTLPPDAVLVAPSGQSFSLSFFEDILDGRVPENLSRQELVGAFMVSPSPSVFLEILEQYASEIDESFIEMMEVFLESTILHDTDTLMSQRYEIAISLIREFKAQRDVQSVFTELYEAETPEEAVRIVAHTCANCDDIFMSTLIEKAKELGSVADQDFVNGIIQPFVLAREEALAGKSVDEIFAAIWPKTTTIRTLPAAGIYIEQEPRRAQIANDINITLSQEKNPIEPLIKIIKANWELLDDRFLKINRTLIKQALADEVDYEFPKRIANVLERIKRKYPDRLTIQCEKELRRELLAGTLWNCLADGDQRRVASIVESEFAYVNEGLIEWLKRDIEGISKKLEEFGVDLSEVNDTTEMPEDTKLFFDEFRIRLKIYQLIQMVTAMKADSLSSSDVKTQLLLSFAFEFVSMAFYQLRSCKEAKGFHNAFYGLYYFMDADKRKSIHANPHLRHILAGAVDDDNLKIEARKYYEEVLAEAEKNDNHIRRVEAYRYLGVLAMREKEAIADVYRYMALSLAYSLKVSADELLLSLPLAWEAFAYCLKNTTEKDSVGSFQLALVLRILGGAIEEEKIEDVYIQDVLQLCIMAIRILHKASFIQIPLDVLQETAKEAVEIAKEVDKATDDEWRMGQWVQEFLASSA